MRVVVMDTEIRCAFPSGKSLGTKGCSGRWASRRRRTDAIPTEEWSLSSFSLTHTVPPNDSYFPSASPSHSQASWKAAAQLLHSTHIFTHFQKFHSHASSLVCPLYQSALSHTHTHTYTHSHTHLISWHPKIIDFASRKINLHSRM